MPLNPLLRQPIGVGMILNWPRTCYFPSMEHKGNSVAALHFYVDAGVDETIGHNSVGRFAESQAPTPLQVADVG